jgi:drug/metabolite transporter (DMT)-like permease
LAAIFATPMMLWEICTDGYVVFSAGFIGILVYVSLGASILGYAFWNSGVACIGLSRTSIIHYLLPVFCGIEGFVLLDETILTVHVISMALIIAGTFLAVKAKQSGFQRN